MKDYIFENYGSAKYNGNIGIIFLKRVFNSKIIPLRKATHENWNYEQQRQKVFSAEHKSSNKTRELIVNDL